MYTSSLSRTELERTELERTELERTELERTELESCIKGWKLTGSKCYRLKH